MTRRPRSGMDSPCRYLTRSRLPSQILKPPSYTPGTKSDCSIAAATAGGRLEVFGGRHRLSETSSWIETFSKRASIAISSSSSSLSLTKISRAGMKFGGVSRLDVGIDSGLMSDTPSSAGEPKLNLKSIRSRDVELDLRADSVRTSKPKLQTRAYEKKWPSKSAPLQKAG